MPLVERAATLDMIQRLLARASAGQGGTLFVIGKAGLGKTTVLDWAIRAARDLGFKIGTARADVAEAMLPFGVLNQAFEVFGDSTAAGRFWAALRQLRRVADRPMLLALDDLQWADPDSLVLIHLLCRRLAGLQIALIATARPWPDQAASMADALRADNLATLSCLRPLTRVAAETILREHPSMGLSDAVVARGLELCGGNPLLLAELQQMPDFTVQLDLWESADRSFLLSRFLGIGEIERRFVRAASILRPRFRTSVAAEMADIRGERLVDTLQILFAAGLLRSMGDDRAEFAHALIRQAVYRDMPPPARVQLHKLAFQALLNHTAEPAEAAEHAVAAHLVGDAAAIAALSRAGQRALQTGAVRLARQHLECAVNLAGESADHALLLDLANALLGDGAGETAIDVLERLLELPSVPDHVRATALSLLGRAAFMAGRLERAAIAFEAVSNISSLEPDLRVRALLDWAFWTWTCLGPGAGLEVAARARELSSRAAEPLRACADVAWALCAYGNGDPRGGSVALAAATTSEFVRLSSATAAHWALEPSGVPGDVAVWSERFTDAEHLFGELLPSAERRNEPFRFFHAAFSWTDALCRLGRLEEAFTMSERIFEVAAVAPLVLPFAVAARALVLLEQGRLPEAAAWSNQLARLASEHRWFLIAGYDLHRRGTLAWRSGVVEQACAIFDQLQEKVHTWGLQDPATIPWASDAISAYLSCGRIADAERVVEWLARAEPLPSVWPRVVAARGRAGAADHLGAVDRAEHHYREAVSLQSELQLPLPRAETLTEFGAFLARQRDITRARQVLGEAVRIAEEHGAQWHAARARTEWRRAGGRTRRTPPGELTPQEATVARLVRAGRTNRQIAQQLFLSENTVETHLAHVYRKLGIRRRWELIARAQT
jgi:DNA-binding CsgD family transcriptional regulator